MDVDAIDVEGIWWRRSPHGGDPLFRDDPPSDGRWQRGETVGGVFSGEVLPHSATAACDTAGAIAKLVARFYDQQAAA